MKIKFVIIHGDVWKKEDVEESIEWAKTKVWKKEVWSSHSENWDHDHCQICWWKLQKSEDLEHRQGYHNLENDNWVCTECYDQFVNAL